MDGLKKQTMKYIKFLFISVPLALILIITVNIYFEFKRWRK